MSTSSRHFTFTYRARVQTPRVAGASARVWLPQPRSWPWQSITVEELAGAAYAPSEDAREGNTLLHAELPTDGGWHTLTQRYRVTRHPVRVTVPTADASLPADVQRYLAADSLVPVDGPEVEQVAAAARGAAHSAEAARRVYDHMLATFSYDGRGCTLSRVGELGDLRRMCDAGAGTCTEWHALFVGAMRHLGIPARLRFGFNVPDKPQGTVAGYHCWAEVHVGGTWLPVDVSEAKKRPHDADWLFGGLDPHRVEFVVGVDIRLGDEVAEKPIFPVVRCAAGATALEVDFSFESTQARPLGVSSSTHAEAAPRRTPVLPAGMTADEVVDAVSKRYSEVAQRPDGSYGFRVGRPFAEALGYPGEVLDQLPPSVWEAFTGVATPAFDAQVLPGETVVDLGCGGGLDLALLGMMVGPRGRAIGIDFAPGMVERARRNAALLGLPQVEVREASAARTGLPDATADWVVANGILNLSPSKAEILREVTRILKPGGTFLLAETTLTEEISPETVSSPDDWFR
ncbi:MAG: methyltransferase domain-containing protein [Myxococcota bacterium]